MLLPWKEAPASTIADPSIRKCHCLDSAALISEDIATDIVTAADSFELDRTGSSHNITVNGDEISGREIIVDYA